ncbi:peptidyl-prolyl cis-trans isomerase [Pseudoalteromonas neustonica]|uniref:peptidylprolyl isomerase n=1 Tax=Pseudoalteromonas neustonica TaxID=1840331 RepID=UPI0007DB5EC9|nr:peptidylprolyl isomerase [Pseudoalteromonas neustonica]
MKGLTTILLLLLGGLYSPLTVASFNQYTNAEVRFMHQVYKQHNTNISIKEVRTRVFENQFLLQQAEQNMPELIARQSEVGFSTQYHVERYLMNIFNSQLSLSGHNIKTVNFTQYTTQWLIQVLANYPADGKYTAEQVIKLQRTSLNKLFVNPITLYDFITPLSMQVRFRLHQGDSNLFRSEVLKKRQFNAALLAATPLLLKKRINIDHLQELAKGEILRPSIQSWLGIKNMMHVQSPILDSLEQQISDEEIKIYYQANKKRFKYLNNVTAYGVEFTSREDAIKFRKAVHNSSFTQALTSFKQHDIYAQYQNMLTRKNKSNWVIQLAFTQKEDELSHVIRSPDGLWVVIMSNNHHYKYFTSADETVIYQAKKAIAIQKAKHSYQQNWLAWQQQNAILL